MPKRIAAGGRYYIRQSWKISIMKISCPCGYHNFMSDWRDFIRFRIPFCMQPLRHGLVHWTIILCAIEISLLTQLLIEIIISSRYFSDFFLSSVWSPSKVDILSDLQTLNRYVPSILRTYLSSRKYLPPVEHREEC